MKKITSIIICLLIAALFTGCSSTRTTPKCDVIQVIQFSFEEGFLEEDCETVRRWVDEMPEILKRNISEVHLVYNIHEIAEADPMLPITGVTVDQSKIYLNAETRGKIKKTLYHEAGHCLDFAGKYSETSEWKTVMNAEWKDEGYYSSDMESFADAIARHYMNTLEDKPQTSKFIEKILEQQESI